MKICLLSRRFYLGAGGIGRVGVEIRNKLEELGHEVYTVATAEEDLVHYFKYSFWGIRSKIPRDCDIYHAITPMESIWIPKDKAIATILDIIPITDVKLHGARIGEGKIRQFIAKTCFTIGCNKAAQCKHIVCISEHVRQEFIKHFGVPEDKISVIRLGIRDDLKPKHKMDKVFRIGYLGQLDRRKRVDLLINAFKASDIKGELVIAGKGVNEDKLKLLAGGDKRIRFLGYLENGSICKFYNSLDYFVFPSAIEGFGLPPVEAMACKIPVVVLADAIMPEEVKSRCVVVDDLSEAFKDIQSRTRFKGISKNLNYRFAKDHNWNSTVNEYVKLYEVILKG